MPDYAGNGWIRVRGSSSALFYPKKQYSFETWGDEDKDLSVSLFGMPTVSSGGGAEWLYEDLGVDSVLHSVTIDWETANATTYEIRMRTDAQGPAESPGDWTRVATVNGANWLPEGGRRRRPPLRFCSGDSGVAVWDWRNECD